MWTRRRFLWRGTGAMIGLGSAALGWHSFSQERMADASLSRDMITPEAQTAIDSGLAYLYRNQHADGSFGTGRHEGNIAITSLCGLAFMAGGHQPGRGRYGRAVTKALQFIINHEHRGTPGYLFNASSTLHGPMYGHGFGTLFLAEACGMAPNARLRDDLRGTLDRAVQLIINTQNVEGGWRYQPARADADLSVTICQIMALRAARNAGFAVPKTVADNCTQYVRNCQDRFSGGFRYQQRGGPVGFARTAAGVVALYSAGIYDGDEVKKGLDYLVTNCMPGRNQNNPFSRHDHEMQIHYYYGHYYAAQAMWIAGGDYWRNWYRAIRDELLQHDRQGDGSWFDHRICPHYSTAMALIILQIPNHYLPILQR